ncbi:MAG: peptidase S11, partial [Casimicrobiaceae bacterium]
MASAGIVGPDPAKLKLKSANVLIVGAGDGSPIYSKNAESVTPIASITKLMTAMVVLDAHQP